MRSRFNVGARNTQQGTEYRLNIGNNAHLAHAGQPFQSGTAQQLVQYCFSLVICVLCEQNVWRALLFERRVTCRACRTLQTGWGLLFDVNVTNCQRDITGDAKVGTKNCPGIRVETQTVMYMDRVQIDTQRSF